MRENSRLQHPNSGNCSQLLQQRSHVPVRVFHPRCSVLEENGRKRSPAGKRKIPDTRGGSGASLFISAETTENICTAAVMPSECTAGGMCDLSLDSVDDLNDISSNVLPSPSGVQGGHFEAC